VAGKTVVAAAGNFDVDAWLALAAEQLFAACRQRAIRRAARRAGPVRRQALARRFSQVSQVFLNMAYPLAPARPTRCRSSAGAWRLRWRPTCSAAACPRRWWTRCASGSAWPTRRIRDGQRRRLGQLRRPCRHHAGQAGAAGDATGALLRAQAAGIDPVHLERAKNQLAVSRVRVLRAHLRHDGAAVEELLAAAA
jgi:hypothetical protein